jgi:DNA-binding transcriptional LysR family regulator
MNPHRLRYFATVARLCNFGKAAQEMNMSQPALSRQIQILESELGTTLFSRENKHVELTETGKLLLERSAALLEDIQQLKLDISKLEKRVSNHLTIGAIQSAIDNWLASRVANARQRFPEATIVLREFTSPDIVDRVRRGYLDIGVVGSLPMGSGVKVAARIHEGFYVLLSSSHRLARKPHVRLEELAGEMQVQFRNGYLIRDSVDASLKKAGVCLDVGAEVDSISAIRAFVSAASHISILPEFTARNCRKDGSIAAIPIIDIDLVRTIYVIHHSGRKLSPLAQNFLREVQSPRLDDDQPVAAPLGESTT